MEGHPTSSPPLKSTGGPSLASISAFAVIGLVVLYFLGIHHAYPSTLGKSLVHWTWLACNSKNDFLHGRFIPLVFVVLSVIAWKKARTETRIPSMSWGIVGISIGIGLYLMSIRAIQPRLALFGLPFLILGSLMIVFGPKVTKHFIFPAFFWYFTIPIPGVQQATALLQVVVTESCYHVGTFFGMQLINDGNTISAVGSKAWNFDIAEGCSGIRSLMSLAMIAAIYANYTQKTLWKKLFLFACSLPLALLGNFGRIFTIMVLAQMGFQKFAAATYHDWAGILIFFPIALIGLFVIDSLLNFNTRIRKKVVRREVSRTKVAPQKPMPISDNPQDSTQ